MKRFLRNALIWLAGLVAILAILLILLYAEEDWRGARDWAACQKELVAKGETLNLRQLAPPGKPEDDLSKVPIFAEKLKDDSEDQHEHQFEGYLFHWDHFSVPDRLKALDVYLNTSDYKKRPNFVYYASGKRFDLAEWQAFYRSLPTGQLANIGQTPAQNVLAIMARFNPELTEIDQAVNNPNAYWPIDIDKPYLTSIDDRLAIGRPAMILALKGVAYLANNESDKAVEAYSFSFRLNHPFFKNCLQINSAVIGNVRFTDDTILCEGLHLHAWNDSQLRQMESDLASFDMLSLAVDALRLERACGIASANLIQQGGVETLRQAAGVREFDKYGYFDSIRLLGHRPSGEWDQDKCYYARGIQQRIDAVHLTRGTIDPAAFDLEQDTERLSGWNRINRYLSWIQLRGADIIGRRIACAETYRRLARLACRLEEYRIAKGQYPEKLEELPDLPPHLNQEVLSEQPLRYSRKGDGYQLYSVGWNQKDDDGVIAKDSKDGDWVWPSP